MREIGSAGERVRSVVIPSISISFMVSSALSCSAHRSRSFFHLLSATTISVFTIQISFYFISSSIVPISRYYHVLRSSFFGIYFGQKLLLFLYLWYKKAKKNMFVMFMSYATCENAVIITFFNRTLHMANEGYCTYAQIKPYKCIQYNHERRPMMLLISTRSLSLPVLKHLPRQRFGLHLVLDIHSWSPSSLLSSTRLAGLGGYLALGTCKGRWAGRGFGGFGRRLG